MSAGCQYTGNKFAILGTGGSVYVCCMCIFYLYFKEITNILIFDFMILIESDIDLSVHPSVCLCEYDDKSPIYKNTYN